MVLPSKSMELQCGSSNAIGKVGIAETAFPGVVVVVKVAGCADGATLAIGYGMPC